jgi:hypothetical protein
MSSEKPFFFLFPYIVFFSVIACVHMRLHLCLKKPGDINIQLFKLRLSPSKAEKSNMSAKGLLGSLKNL